MSFSHKTPSYPEEPQSHVTPLGVSVHWEPFWHGFAAQLTVSQKSPLYPVGQMQMKFPAGSPSSSEQVPPLLQMTPAHSSMSVQVVVLVPPPS